MSKIVAVWKSIRNRFANALKNLVKDFRRVSSREGWIQRAKLIQNAPESPQVAFGVVRPTTQYFGSHVVVGYSTDGLLLDVTFGSESL